MRYAQIRGVRVVPEIEGPSHVHALGLYPKLKGLIGCYRDTNSVNGYHGGVPYAPISPVHNETYEFLEGFLKDMDEMFPSSYFHLGGDEVSVGCLNGVPEFRNKMGELGLNDNQLQ